MTTNGYVKIFRKILDWQWYNKDYMLRVWIYLLMNARHDNGNVWGVPLRAGQLVAGRKQMSKDLCLSEQSIRTAINRLKSTNEITVQSTNKYSVITIVNWADYQDDIQEITNNLTEYPTIEQPTINQQSTTNKNGKNGKNGKKSIYGQFKHVLLTNDQLAKLNEEYGEATVQKYIRELDEGIELHGYRYKNHYLAMINWIRRDRERQVKKEDTLPTYIATDISQDRLDELMRRRNA